MTLPPNHCFFCSIGLSQWRHLQELVCSALECSFALNLIILTAATFFVKLSQGNPLAVGYTSISIAFATLIGILVFQLASGVDSIHYLKWKSIAKAIRNQAETDTMSLPGSPVPDRLINLENFEPPFSTPQGHTTAEPTDGAQRRLIPAYT